MSFLELGSVLFRGQLRGATGQARFKLTVNAINAVDTLNIAGNQVTYNTYLRWYGGSVANGSVMCAHTIDIPDNNVYAEIIAYAHNAGSVTVDGVTRPNRNRRGPNLKCLPFVEVLPLAKGLHTIRLISAATGSSAGGYIVCRYIRTTGASNT